MRLRSQTPFGFRTTSSVLVLLLWVAAILQAQQQGVEEKSSDLSPANRLVKAAHFRTTQAVRYDPAYVVLEYPGGDVPADTGVCTDVVIRSYRAALGVDLQKLVHEDMRSHFSAYPKNWGLKRADKNIDHRRVPNLQRFFKRNGAELNVTENSIFLPGDLVAWDLNDRGLWHIGIVVGEDSFIHNIGSGPELSHGIRQWKIVGHYRYFPTPKE